MNKKIAVIGSNSFSGASFVNITLNSGYSVIGVSRSAEQNDLFLPYGNHPQRADRFSFHQLDINNDLDLIIELMETERPEYIVNFAAQAMVAESWLYPEHWFMTNTVSTTLLFNRLKDLSFIKKYVHVTTPEVYGSCSGYVKEGQPFNPSTPYAASRAAGDMSLKTFVDNYGFPAVSSRAANVYGAGQQLYRIIPRTILYIRQGKKLQLHGGGHSERSFIHINDVADATLKLAVEGEVGEVYHIATQSTISIRNLVQLVCDEMETELEEVVDIVDDRPGKDAAYLLDSTKIREQLGWRDVVTLEQGIDEVRAWIDANLAQLEQQVDRYIHKI